jgi:5-methyltetrahydropteroyltriglutamate--homocysteine methyltransferase
MMNTSISATTHHQIATPEHLISSVDLSEIFQQAIDDHLRVVEQLRQQQKVLKSIAMRMTDAILSGGKVLWCGEGGYDAIAEKLFGTLEVDRYLLEYDDERSGTFEPLRFVPKGKTVVLGLISSKLPRMERPELLAKRIDEASRYVPLDNLALSPQCGFASTAEGNLMTEDQQWAKLKLVVQTARRVWN